MANKVTIEIEGLPVAKARPRFNRRTGVTYTPGKTVEAERRITNSFYEVIDGYEGTWEVFPLQKPTPVDVSITFQFTPPQSWSKAKQQKAMYTERFKTTKPDIDNLTKTVMDALNGHAWVDDSQVVQLTARKVYGESDKTYVTIKDAVPAGEEEVYRYIDCQWR